MKNLLIILLIFLIACSNEQQNSMEKFQGQTTVTINLDELPNSRIPKEIGQLKRVVNLTIQVTQSKGNWTVFPPLSWYETRELKEPFRNLPESIGEIGTLRSLQLPNLDIGKLPSSISRLENLEFLDVSMNKLNLTNELPKLESLPNLRHLRVFGNHFNEKAIKDFKHRNPDIEVEYNVKTNPNN